MANFFEEFARKLGAKPPKPPRPVPDLMNEGEFGPMAGQPVAALGVAVFDVAGLGLLDAELVAAKKRVVANLRKIGGEAIRAARFAQALQAPVLAAQAQSMRPAPDTLPDEPVPVPRQVIMNALRTREAGEERYKATAHITQTAAQRNLATSQRAITAAGGEVAYNEQQRAARARAEALAAYRAEWNALAQAGDPAGKAWVIWQQTEQALTHHETQLRAAAIYATTPGARAHRDQLQAALVGVKATRDAAKRQFDGLKLQRDKFIAAQQLTTGKHPAQVRFAELVALRAASRANPPTHHFTVGENVAQTALHKQLIALGYPP